MNGNDPALDAYRGQLNRWVTAMANTDNEAVADDVAEGYSVGDVDLFTEGNFDKRADILLLQLSFLTSAWEALEEHIDEYIATQPLAAFAAGPADAAAFLHWLRAANELTPRQIDFIDCRLARYDVEDAARVHRGRHIRFQERLSAAGRLARQMKRNRRLLVHLNPACGWTTLHTHEFLDERTQLPGNVVFFAVGTQIHSAVLDDPVPQLLTLLQDGPLTLDAWRERAGLPKTDDLIAVARRLVDVGLLAFS